MTGEVKRLREVLHNMRQKHRAGKALSCWVALKRLLVVSRTAQSVREKRLVGRCFAEWYIFSERNYRFVRLNVKSSSPSQERRACVRNRADETGEVFKQMVGGDKNDDCCERSGMTNFQEIIASADPSQELTTASKVLSNVLYHWNELASRRKSRRTLLYCYR